MKSIASDVSSDDVFLAYGAAFAHSMSAQRPQCADLEARGPFGEANDAPFQRQNPTGPPSLKRRRPRYVKRSLKSTFDAVESIHGMVTPPHPRQALAPPASLACARDNAKIVGISSEDASNGSVQSVENQQSTSQIVDSRGRSRGNVTNVADVTCHQYVPLLDLLIETDRGSSLSMPEAKALIYSLAEDLSDVHARRGLHTSVCLESATLDIVDGTGRASLLTSFAPANTSNTLDYPQPQLVWPAVEVLAGKAPVSVHPYTMPPEMAHCRQDVAHRALTNKGNMWSLGCIMFSLLAGGRDAFGEQGVGVCGGETLLLSVDRQQAWLSAYLSDVTRRINVNTFDTFDPTDQSKEKPRKRDRVFADGSSVVGFDDVAMNLLSGLLRVDPGQRLTAKEVLRHPWFDGVRQCLPKSRRPGAASSAADGGELRNTGRGTAATTTERSSEDQEMFVSYRSDLKYSELHQRYIFIDPSILSPMHPYTLVGQVKKEIVFESLGESFGGIGVFAVYNVPHHGTMMSAKPIKVIPH